MWMLVGVALLVSPTATATVAYECGMSGTVEASPCCDDHGAAELRADGGVESRPCCTLIERSSLSGDEREPRVNVEAAGLALVAPVRATVSFVPPASLDVEAAASALESSPQWTGPPLFVQHCAYLL